MVTPVGGTVLAVSTDVTELAQREAAVREAERSLYLLTQALEATDVNVTISDLRLPDVPLVFVNRAFCDTTGYSRDEILGRNCRLLQGADTDPDTREEIRAAIRDRRPFVGTVANYRKDGSRFINRLHLGPIRSPEGTPVAYVGIQRDVTREEEQREAQAQRERLEALGRLSGGIAHEINNLLQPITTLPEAIEAGLRPDATEELEDLRLIAESARAARDILKGFLAFTRRDSSAVEPLDALDTVSRALSLVEALQSPGIRVRRAGALASGGACGTAAWSRAQVMQVLSNLVSNAAHAMGGRGEVEVGLDPLPDADGPGFLLLRVGDHGRGMDEETRRRVFEPFFTTKGVGEGTGLGMSVVYGIVQSWKGTIDVQSRPGRGTEVSIRLPRLA